MLVSYKVGENLVGLIPSRELEERRAAFVPPEADVAHSIGNKVIGIPILGYLRVRIF